jgi:hypothetical protein
MEYPHENNLTSTKHDWNEQSYTNKTHTQYTDIIPKTAIGLNPQTKKTKPSSNTKLSSNNKKVSNMKNFTVL